MSAEEKDLMTPAQREAVCKAYSLLGEHFRSSVLMVDFDVDDNDGGDAHAVYWAGGSVAALGLCEFAKDRILHTGKGSIEPPKTFE